MFQSGSADRSVQALPAPVGRELPPRIAHIELSALLENYHLARRVSRRQVIAVVKADAYGHGARVVARALVAAGCRQLAVLGLDEAAALRAARIGVDILLLGGIADAQEARAALELGLTPVLHDRRSLELAVLAIGRGSRKLRVHVEVDTGMQRRGVSPNDAVGLMQAAAGAHPQLELAGVFTHFARADEHDCKSSLDQLRIFRDVLARARRVGIAPPWIHADNSAGVISNLGHALPEATAVRPGLMLYGVNPLCAGVEPPPLRPVMTVTAPVVQVRAVAAGSSVGYGGTFRVERATRVATVLFGYADGYPCQAAGRACVWLAGRARPVLGRVSMDYICVDIEDASVEPGAQAIIFGGAGEQAIPVELLASWSNTIPYELLVRVGRRVRRATSMSSLASAAASRTSPG